MGLHVGQLCGRLNKPFTDKLNEDMQEVTATLTDVNLAYSIPYSSSLFSIDLIAPLWLTFGSDRSHFRC